LQDPSWAPQGAIRDENDRERDIRVILVTLEARVPVSSPYVIHQILLTGMIELLQRLATQHPRRLLSVHRIVVRTLYRSPSKTSQFPGVWNIRALERISTQQSHWPLLMMLSYEHIEPSPNHSLVSCSFHRRPSRVNQILSLTVACKNQLLEGGMSRQVRIASIILF
jgi:hypothetical protein